MPRSYNYYDNADNYIFYTDKFKNYSIFENHCYSYAYRINCFKYFYAR